MTDEPARSDLWASVRGGIDEGLVKAPNPSIDDIVTQLAAVHRIIRWERGQTAQREAAERAALSSEEGGIVIDNYSGVVRVVPHIKSDTAYIVGEFDPEKWLDNETTEEVS